MNTLINALLSRSRLVLACALLMLGAGLASWWTMPRQEDPTMPDRAGFIVATLPGADAQSIERLVVKPLERSLTQVSQVKILKAVARANVAIVSVRLEDSVDQTSEAWDEVEDALTEAQADLPDTASTPELTTGLITDQEAVVLAVTGASDPLVLKDAARRLKDSLIRVPGVAKVFLSAEPSEQITVRYDEVTASSLGLSPAALVQQLAARNQTIPGGTIKLGGRAAVVQPNADLQSLRDLSTTQIKVGPKSTLALQDIASVVRGPRSPAESITRLDGATAVAVSIVPKAKIDIVTFGQRVRDELKALRPKLAPLAIEEMSFQPERVEERLVGLGGSLLMGVGIVALVLIVMMGVRLGLVVSSVVPLVALTSLAVFATGGGILHQISISALIIALGMLVDNAIVVAENVQRCLDEGAAPLDAARSTIRELALPLMTATGTTIAAFIPMYASSGPTGDFTRAIPQVIMLTLVISYLFALIVTPLLATAVLKPDLKKSQSRLDLLGGAIAARALGRPARVLLLMFCLVGISGFLARYVDASFFPASGRNQLVVELMLPEGAHIEETNRASERLERWLQKDPQVEQVAAFVGQSAPKFYYNLPNRPNSPHFAHLVIRTVSPEVVPELLERVSGFARRSIPEAEVIPRTLEQGPPLNAPIEIRLLGDELKDLHAGAESVMELLHQTPHTRNVRHDMGLGAPSLQYAIDDASAADRGLFRAQVAQAVLSQTRGLRVGQLRSTEEPIDIVVRSTKGEDIAPSRLRTLKVANIPIGQLASLQLRWIPAVVHRRNAQRAVTVSAQLDQGVAFGAAFKVLGPKLETLKLPAGVRYELGGAKEGSQDANAAIVTAAPIGALMLLFFLMAQFNSFRRVFIILTTVPLAAAGVVPGLLLADQPFGFMSLLGVIALVGVVVNNAIVLLDVVERRRAEGSSTPEALAQAVTLRTRPILLTTLTTVAGLLPLALSDSPLWPPMAWAMIAGLLSSTLLTLAVVPALYTVLMKRGAS